jgi:hypothetical protein
MPSVEEEVRQVLEATVTAENGPVGLVYGAMDKTGKVLVKEAFGKKVLDSADDVSVTRLGILVSCMISGVDERRRHFLLVLMHQSHHSDSVRLQAPFLAGTLS